MLHENLKALRKAAGISQEELAIRLNVVRQTISKWEKGLSVPDAEMLIRIAEVFEVSVSELLGAGFESRAEQPSVAEQLSRINEQLAIKNRRARRIWRIIAGVVITVVVVNVLLIVLSFAAFSAYGYVRKNADRVHSIGALVPACGPSVLLPRCFPSGRGARSGGDEPAAKQQHRGPQQQNPHQKRSFWRSETAGALRRPSAMIG